ncbi:MAG: lipase maturation factor family protein [Verrucomicrobiota bacterium]
MKSSLRVSNPPPKPLLIWDGECHFCRLWIERWREITNGEVDYATSQEAATRFPEIPRDQFERSMAFVDTEGRAFLAAEAVYRSLQYRSSRRWMTWSYDHVPGFAAISETAYEFVAHHRQFGSLVTRLLWGGDTRPPTYFWARTWFLRALGLIYLTAFVSLWLQVDGLIGTNGILPVSQFLPSVQEQFGPHAHWLLPTLCWFNSSDAFLHFLCGGGVALSILLIIGIAPAISLIGLSIFYLSLTIAGQTFLSFQWDIVLVEAGFLSIFLAPWQWWPRSAPAAISKAGLFLLKLLLFKLMLMSGLVKLTSGDDSWLSLTALDYHYWSQPLPTIFAWYADKSPESIKHFSVAFCLIVEIIVPFFIWAPRRPRLIAAGLMIVLQIAIAVTGNYCFFNLLTGTLCLLLIDDAAVRRVERRPSVSPASQEVCLPPRHHLMQRLSIYATVAVVIVTLPVNTWLIYTAFAPNTDWPRPLAMIYGYLESFRIVNGYGLFRVMTKDRLEIVIEGSANGIDWRPYEFRWKPGDVRSPPRWCAPHQPRLDWQMWFAALGNARENPWFVRTLICLLQGKREVEQLFERNPFPDAPPRFIRATSYRYRFATTAERRQTHAWWSREELREYVPAFSLEQLR